MLWTKVASAAEGLSTINRLNDSQIEFDSMTYPRMCALASDTGIFLIDLFTDLVILRGRAQVWSHRQIKEGGFTDEPPEDDVRPIFLQHATDI